MKKRTLLLTIGAVVALAATSLVVATLARRYLDSKTTESSCRSGHVSHVVVISRGQLSATKIQGEVCDTLTIVNNDDKMRLMAFGVHDQHNPYAGTTEKSIAKGESLMVTLDRPGTFTFHDHLQDGITGTFIVTD